MTRAAAVAWTLRAALLAGAVAVLVLLPRALDDFSDRFASDLAFVAIYFVALMGLSLLTGHSGQISLGHGAFMAIGGYTTAILASDQGLKLGGHTFAGDVRDVYTIPLAGLVAGAAGLLFGPPALRLTGLYLALVTFGFAVALPQVIKKYEGFTGGTSGATFFGLETHTGQGGDVDVRVATVTANEWLYYLSWSVALVLLVLAWALLRSGFGRALRAIRDSEVAAASFGISLPLYKTAAFGVSAFYAGVAGSLFAIASLAYVTPETFPVLLSIFLLVGLVVGGLDSLAALVVGAALIQFLPDVAQRVSDAPGAPDIVRGALLIAVMLLIPVGVGGLLRRGVRPLTTRLYTRS